MGGTVSSSSGCVQEALSQSELSNTLKQLGELSREPLEPTELSLEPTPDAAGHPLALLLNAPRSLKLDDVEFSISESLRFPFRLVRVTVYVLPQAVPSQKSDVSHTIMRLISCMALRATLELPAATLQRSQQWFYFLGQSPATDPVSIKLQTCIRDSNADSCGESRHGCCVLVEIPVPAGIVLRPGTEILLTASIAGTRTGLRIPAYGHIHSTSCNHTRARGGAVLLAAQTGSRVALEAALASGGSTEEVDYYNDTALGVAAEAGNVECVRILLAAGANVNSATWHGRTPLHHAAAKNHPAVVTLLLADPRVNPHAKTKAGETPLDVAIAWGHPAVVALLESESASRH